MNSLPSDSPEISKDFKTVRARAAIVSMSAGVLILTLKWIAARVSGSTALQSDAIESIVNVVAAGAAFAAVSFGGQPADDEHPYGHGKAEHFSAALEGSLILVAGLLILFQAWRSWIQGPALTHLGLGMWINFAAGLANGALGVYLLRAGRRSRSHAIEADAHHVLSDFYTTIAVLGGLLAAQWLGWLWMDAAIAALVGLLLLWTGISLMRKSAGALLDAEDPQVVADLLRAMERLRTPDIIGVHALRTLRSGSYVHVDLHVVVPEFYDVARAHDLVEGFGSAFITASGHEGEAHTHMDPCARRYCEGCSVNPCPIRRVPMVARGSLLTADPEAHSEQPGH